MTLASLFEQTAARDGGRTAIIWGDELITFLQIESRTRGLAQHLASKLGIRRGDRIAVLQKNSPDYIISLYGIYRAGATAVPLNVFLKPEEIRYILGDGGIKTIIISPEFEGHITKVREIDSTLLANVLQVGDAGWDELQKPIANETLPQIAPDDLALLVYTSGTTGRPKGVMLTHANLSSNVTSCIRCLRAVHDDILLLALPMFHSFMLTVGIALPLSAGACILLVRTLMPFAPVLEEMVRQRVTIFLGVPALYQMLADAKIPPEIHDKLSIRLAISGSAPLPVETLTAFGQKFRFPLIEGYGLSEASPVVSLNPIEGVRKPGSVGLPIPEVEIALLDDADREVPVGESGELCVRGPNVMRGYFNQPEQTAATIRNDWLHTGDIAKKDSDGYYYIVDRKKDMLLVKGNNVYPREIEEVIYQIKGVSEAAVVGKPDKASGELPVAFVVAAAGISLDEKAIRAFCKERLADYKLPREVRFLEKLPRNATAKVDKKELRKML